MYEPIFKSAETEQLHLDKEDDNFWSALLVLFENPRKLLAIVDTLRTNALQDQDTLSQQRRAIIEKLKKIVDRVNKIKRADIERAL